MNKVLGLVAIFLTSCVFCYAEVEYNVIPLSAAGEEFIQMGNKTMGPNAKGQTIGRAGLVYFYSWMDDPVTGRHEIPGVNRAFILTDAGHVMGLLNRVNPTAYIWSPEEGFYEFNSPDRDFALKAANIHDEVVFDQLSPVLLSRGDTHLLTKDKEVISLGHLDTVWSGRTGSRGHSINDHSQVVGASYAGRDYYMDGEASRAKDILHAFIWDENNGMRDLNQLIPSNSGWLLTEANYINNGGFIKGKGEYQGQVLEFLLIPVMDE